MRTLHSMSEHLHQDSYIVAESRRLQAAARATTRLDICQPLWNSAVMLKIVADMHTHTIASGHAYSTVNELAHAAAAKGLAAMAITDHGPALPGGPHLYHFGA